MPETSIVIKAQDSYSSALESMRSKTKAFSKDNEDMEKILTRLNRNKYEVKLELDKAKRELRELEKQYQQTGDAADKLALEAGQDKFEAARRNYSLLTKGAREAEKQMEKTAETFRKVGNSTGGSGEGGGGSLITSLATSGLVSMVGQLGAKGLNTWASSLNGSEVGTVVSSILSSATSGAAIGSVIAPGIGTVIGAGVGLAAGVASGELQNFEKQDDAFKSYVQTSVENQYSQRESDISSGSTIAAGREKDLISFSTLFGDRKTAEGYLSDLVGMANTTPFLYDDLTAMSKTLATYGYGANGILPVLQTIGDAGAALGMGTSDMSMVATALGRMKSSNKTTLEYLNILNDRGVGAVGMLADAYGTDQGTIYSKISKGEIAGTDAVEIILQALEDKFSGSMLEQSKTFSGLTSTLEGMNQEQQNAYGEGYNEARKKGLSDQISFLSGENGEQMEAANKAIGAWYASLENEKERFLREAQKEVLESDAYKEAMAAGTDEGYAEAGKLLMEAKVKAQNEYNASEGAQLMKESELSLINEVRADASVKEEYWNAGYDLGQEFTKGLAAGSQRNKQREFEEKGLTTFDVSNLPTYLTGGSLPAGGYAYGLDRVPYDNFPALLHEGERVLTASQARAADRSGGGVAVHIGQVTFGASVSDPEAAAEQFARALERALLLATPG